MEEKYHESCVYGPWDPDVQTPRGGMSTVLSTSRKPNMARGRQTTWFLNAGKQELCCPQKEPHHHYHTINHQMLLKHTHNNTYLQVKLVKAHLRCCVSGSWGSTRAGSWGKVRTGGTGGAASPPPYTWTTCPGSLRTHKFEHTRVQDIVY